MKITKIELKQLILEELAEMQDEIGASDNNPKVESQPLAPAKALFKREMPRIINMMNKALTKQDVQQTIQAMERVMIELDGVMKE